MDATFATNSSPATIDWIRKRDGEVVRLESEKLAQSIEHAADQMQNPLTHDAVAELARMSLYFLRANVTHAVASSDEVAEWTEKSLRETGQAALADQYAQYRQRKLWAQQSLRVAGGELHDTAPRSPAPCWDKARLVQVLRTRLRLDPRRARAVASQVERYLIRGRFESVTTDLLRELANSELERWHERQRLSPSGQIHIRAAELSRALASPEGFSAASTALNRRVWHDYALNEVVSRDVAESQRRGLLCLDGLGHPASIAAACVDCGTIARQAQSFRQSIVEFSRTLADAVDASAQLVAIDRVESWLSFVAEPGDTPSRLAEQFWIELIARLRYSSLTCVLNLYGGMPPGADDVLGAGPLFRQQPLSADREFAGAVSQEILDLFRRDAAGWSNLRLDWHWVRAPDPVQTALSGRVLRAMDEGHRIAVAFDREPQPLGEGLRRLRDHIRPVLDYIGMSLPVLWRDSGAPRSLAALEESLRQAVQLAVRAAVQKREFMRRLPPRSGLAALDQAVVAIYPIGLDWTVRQLIGRSAAEDEGGLKLCEALVRFLRDAAGREARHFGLAAIIDCPAELSNPYAATNPRNGAEHIAGLTPDCPTLGLKRQIHAAGRLHAIAQAGTLVCRRYLTPIEHQHQLIETLDWSLHNSELVRLQLVADRADQAVVQWPE